MDHNPPERIAINHDDYHAEYVGTTPDGRQFFLTTPFVPAIGQEVGAEFLALYLFDEAGQLLEAKIEDFGPRQQLNKARYQETLKLWLAGLGEITFGDIEVTPFHIERFGVEFGLILEAPENEDEHWWVTVEPGDYMAFSPPWDGDYDT